MLVLLHGLWLVAQVEAEDAARVDMALDPSVAHGAALRRDFATEARRVAPPKYNTPVTIEGFGESPRSKFSGPCFTEPGAILSRKSTKTHIDNAVLNGHYTSSSSHTSPAARPTR